MRGQGRTQGGQIADHGHVVFAAPVYHVLADDHAKAVAMIVPACAFHFDMLAQHVKAHFFHGPDVIQQGFVGRSGIESVRPVALVQYPH